MRSRTVEGIIGWILILLIGGLIGSALYGINRAAKDLNIREAVISTIAEGVLLAEQAKARADSIGGRIDEEF